MTREPDTRQTRPAGDQAFSTPQRSASIGTYPMTKAQLALYDFNSIEFTQDGEPCHGFLSYDPLRGLFAIVYSVIEQEGEKRRTLELRDDQIERIVYDEAAEILILA